jgi:hypothetical protein
MPKSRVASPQAKVKVKPAGAPAATANLPGKLPSQSLSKARAAFKNFSLSKFAGASSVPSNFVPSGQQVTAVQERHQVNQLKSLDASGRRLRVALSDSALKQQLPSFDGKTVVLQELMDLIQRKMRGTEFYVAGNPTLARLSVQSRVDDIIQTIKSGSDTKPK